MTIRAIETRYAGCRFRSRLEARWAVFFDTLGITWEYEPQGFELPSGPYLPDFWLPEINTWYEVKGTMPNGPEWRRLEEFSEVLPHGTWRDWKSSQYLKVAVGPIPDPRTIGRILGDHQGEQIFRLIPIGDLVSRSPRTWIKCDAGHTWVGWEWCWRCGTTDATSGGRVALSLTGDKRHRDVLSAYTAARSARFEHGEAPRSPAPPRSHDDLTWSPEIIRGEHR